MEKIRAVLFCTLNTTKRVSKRLESIADIELSIATSPDTLFHALTQFDTDVVLIESSPDTLALIEEIQKRYPTVRLLILAQEIDIEDVRQTISAGAMGYLLTESDANKLASGIRLVHIGKFTVSQEIIPLLITAS
jgi:DNA-binding NarL/FixJ family response regulator